MREAIEAQARQQREVAAVLCRLAPHRARGVVELLQAMELHVSDHPDMDGRACDLSVRLGAHVFDAIYHAVALSEARCDAGHRGRALPTTGRCARGGS